MKPKRTKPSNKELVTEFLNYTQHLQEAMEAGFTKEQAEWIIKHCYLHP